MVIIRCCSLVTPITAAIFAGCAKLPFPALQDAAEQRSAGKPELRTWPVSAVTALLSC